MSLQTLVLRIPLTLVLLRDLLLKMLDQRLVDVFDVRVVAAPFVDTQTLLFGEEGGEELHVGGGGGCVDHTCRSCQLGLRWERYSVRRTLKADILVEPDAPADPVFSVDGELFSEEVVALLVDLLVVILVG